MIRIVEQHPELLRPDEPGSHVWVVIAALRTSVAEVREHVASGTRLQLDTDRVAWAELGCALCEKAWTSERAEQPCPGAVIAFEPGQVATS